jgi:hypothetical protein
VQQAEVCRKNAMNSILEQNPVMNIVENEKPESRIRMEAYIAMCSSDEENKKE